MNAPEFSSKPFRQQFDEHFQIEEIEEHTVVAPTYGMDDDFFGSHEANIDENFDFFIGENSDSMSNTSYQDELENVDPKVHMIGVFFASVKTSAECSLDCELFIKNLIELAIVESTAYLNNHPLYRGCQKLKGILHWIQQSVPNGITANFIQDPSQMKNMYRIEYEGGGNCTLTFESIYTPFIYLFSALYNIRLWILGGGEAPIFKNIADELKKYMDLLDADCPIFFKYYQSLLYEKYLLESQELPGKDVIYQLDSAQTEKINEVMNNLGKRVFENYKGIRSRTPLPKQISQFVHVFENTYVRCRHIRNFKFYRAGAKISCTFDCGPDKCVSFSQWDWKYLDLIKILFLIFDTKVFINSFPLEAENFDAQQDIYNLYEITIKKYLSE